MSLITRCPACQTMFRVVPDQLRISEGWVRCGQCDEIFDASIHLVQTAHEEVAQVEPASDPVNENSTVDLSNIVPSEADFEGSYPVGNAEFDPPAPFVTDWTPDPVNGLRDTFDAPEELTVPTEFSPLVPTATVADEAVFSVSAVAIQDPDIGPVVDVTPEAKSSEQVDSDEPAEEDSVSFLQAQDKSGFWHQTLVKVALIFLGSLLFAGLAVQVVFQERDRIAAMAPGVTPWLETLCRPLNCTLSPLRRIESIAIESSSFTKIRGDAYTLSFTLKNAAPTPLALPAIELTLTDSADQPVVRRVFQPSELKVNSAPLLSGAEWSVQLAMEIKANAAANKVVGYRLLAFYP